MEALDAKGFSKPCQEMDKLSLWSVLGHSLQKSVVSYAPTISHSLKLDKETQCTQLL